MLFRIFQAFFRLFTPFLYFVLCLSNYNWNSQQLWPWERYFNSHASCEAWPGSSQAVQKYWYFNSHASCEAWHLTKFLIIGIIFISTHTPHARRDRNVQHTKEMQEDFNSHASCEAWQMSRKVTLNCNIFQLTRLMRGVTESRRFVPPRPQFQLTRLMRGVTHTTKNTVKKLVFQLTRLMRGVTKTSVFICRKVQISTHTPHARRDNEKTAQIESSINFNSHASCEAWRKLEFLQRMRQQFQLTRLMRGVTRGFLIVTAEGEISTHTPHARRDYAPVRV